MKFTSLLFVSLAFCYFLATCADPDEEEIRCELPPNELVDKSRIQFIENGSNNDLLREPNAYNLDSVFVVESTGLEIEQWVSFGSLEFSVSRPLTDSTAFSDVVSRKFYIHIPGAVDTLVANYSIGPNERCGGTIYTHLSGTYNGEEILESDISRFINLTVYKTL